MVAPISALSSHPHVLPLRPSPAPRVVTAVSSPGSPFSAERLHEILRHTHRLGERGRARFAMSMLVMSRWRLYRELGFASFLEYARVVFGCDYFQIREYLRIARSLGFLPIALSWCERGALSFEKLGILAGVATPETEAHWLDIAREEPVEKLRERARRDDPTSAERIAPGFPEFRFPGGYSRESPLDVYA